MIDILFNVFYVAALFWTGFFCGYVVARQQRRRQIEGDSILMIKPPRQYVDEDGRSDFRPELREQAERRRIQRVGQS